MTDPTLQRDPRDPADREERTVMGDHPDLEPDEEIRRDAAESDNTMSRLLAPGIILLVIALVIIAYFLFID